MLNRNIVIFLVICFLGVGSILVYANSVRQGDQSNSGILGTSVNAVTPAQNSQQDSLGQSQYTQPINQDQNMQSNQSNQNVPGQQASNPAVNSSPSSLPPYTGGEVTQLLTKDESMGTGEAVKAGDSVEVNYIGTFLDGKKFDSSYDRHQTFSFQVGAGQVIRGWDEGLIGMKTGGKRLLVIPSDLAYGETGSEGAIPPNTPLMFQVEVVSIKPSQY